MSDEQDMTIVEMFERVGKLVEQRDELLTALKLCAYRLEMDRQELLVLNEDSPNDVQNEAADNADKEAVALANAAIAKAEGAVGLITGKL